MGIAVKSRLNFSTFGNFSVDIISKTLPLIIAVTVLSLIKISILFSSLTSTKVDKTSAISSGLSSTGSIFSEFMILSSKIFASLVVSNVTSSLTGSNCMKSSGVTFKINGVMVSFEILTLTIVVLLNSLIWIMMTGSDLLSVC